MEGVGSDLDIFGFFDGFSSLPSQGLCVEEYVRLVLCLSERLGLSDALHRFSLPVLEDLPGSIHPLLCAHLACEDANLVLSDVQALPPVVCGDGCRTHPAPHVHCLFCLRGNAHRGVAEELCDTFLAHSAQHMQQRALYMDLLEGETGDSETEALERAAEAEGRHVCFIISAGTARCPVVVAYCTACDQFAPLVHFTTAAEEEKEEGEGVKEGAEGAAKFVTREPAELVFARVLLACHVLFLRHAQEKRPEMPFAMTAPAAAKPSLLRMWAESWIFLPTPFLFGAAAPEELTEAFEKGALLSHSSAVLPGATLCGSADDPQLCVLEDHASRESDMQSLLTGMPPYYFSDAVVGFAMQWPSEEEAEAKVRWVLQQREGEQFCVRRRLVFVEDTDEWIIARVFCHKNAVEQKDSVEDDSLHSIRMRKNCRIVTVLPMTMARQYTDGEEQSSPENGQGDASTHENNDSGEPDELENCPYGLEARSVQFFGGMTALAKAMVELTAHIEGKEVSGS